MGANPHLPNDGEWLRMCAHRLGVDYRIDRPVLKKYSAFEFVEARDGVAGVGSLQSAVRARSNSNAKTDEMCHRWHGEVGDRSAWVGMCAITVGRYAGAAVSDDDTPTSEV